MELPMRGRQRGRKGYYWGASVSKILESNWIHLQTATETPSEEEGTCRPPKCGEPIAQISCAKGCSALCPPSWVSQEPGHRWLFLGKSVFSFLPCVGLDFPAFGGNIIVCGWGGFDEGKSILKRSSSSPQYYRTRLQIHFFISLGDRVSVCCPGWPGIHGSPAFAT